MGITNFPNGISSFGNVFAGAGIMSFIPPGGTHYWVDPGNESGNASDSNKGTSPSKPLLTLAQGYSLTTDKKNDVVHLMASDAFTNLAVSLTWSNNYTHLVGHCAPTYVAKRARIGHSANFSPMIAVSGEGCIFANIYISHGRGSATNLIGWQDTGGRNFYYNVHFAGPQNATEGDQATYRLVQVSGTTGENTFVGCVFGNDTVNRSAAGTSLHFTGGSPRNTLKDCDFILQADNAGATHMLVDATGVDRELWIKGNTTMISHGTTITQAIDSNITDTTNRKIIIPGTLTVQGATDVADATGDGTIFMTRYTATANVLGLAINPAVS